MTSALETTCCIGGGGPAGMMLGVLLARAGVRTIVLEKHRDFIRDFRGDTIHPSTLELMHELGVLDEFLALPHHKAYHVYGQFGTMRLRVADFTRLPTRRGFIAFMPQWDFLDFSCPSGPAPWRIRAAHGDRGDGACWRRTAAFMGCGPVRPKVSWRFRPIS